MPRSVKSKPSAAEVARSLQMLPNIGPAMAEDLIRLGVRRVEDLARRDPVKMYDELARLDGVRHDPCVLDTFMAVVDHARTGTSKPWWKYTAARKRLMAAGAPIGKRSTPRSRKA